MFTGCQRGDDSCWRLLDPRKQEDAPLSQCGIHFLGDPGRLGQVERNRDGRGEEKWIYVSYCITDLADKFLSPIINQFMLMLL